MGSLGRRQTREGVVHTLEMHGPDCRCAIAITSAGYVPR